VYGFTQVLTEAGIPARNITFLNVVSCPEGIAAMASAWPEVKIITAAVDDHLDGNKYIVPGLGDFGDRYYGTTE
jgi:uracil phosphoribosyltransferase